MKTLHEWIAKGAVSSEIAERYGFTELVRCCECIRRGSYDCPIYIGGDEDKDSPDDWFCADGIAKDTNVINK